MLKDSSKKMFDVNLMRFFYNPEYEKNADVIDAWYTYVLKFLPLVNKRWKEMTSNDKLRNQQSMFHSVTISDEALVQWFVLLWEPILIEKLENKIYSSNNGSNDGGQDNNNGKKDNVRKPHDTKQNIKQYTLLHHQLTVARRDYNAAVRWNNLFWDEVKKRNSDLLGQKITNKYSKYKHDITDLPLPDLNENQEFLATYTLAGFSNNNTSSDNQNTEKSNMNYMAI